MKGILKLAIAATFAVSGFVAAQPAHSGDHGGNHAHVSASHTTNGIVKKVNVAKGTVTFAHEPIPALGWPAMTMDFSVKDKTLFDKLVVGKKITLEFQQQGGENVVTGVK